MAQCDEIFQQNLFFSSWISPNWFSSETVILSIAKWLRKKKFRAIMYVVSGSQLNLLDGVKWFKKYLCSNSKILWHDSMRFHHYCAQQFMQISLFGSYSLFFAFSVLILASYSAFGMPINIKWKQRSKNEAEKDIITYMNCHTEKL